MIERNDWYTRVSDSVRQKKNEGEGMRMQMGECSGEGGGKEEEEVEEKFCDSRRSGLSY